MACSWGHGTDQRLRKENQDRHGVFRFGDLLLALVCDGMGGHAGGAQASAIAVASIHAAFAARTDQPIPETLKSAVQAANDRIYETSSRHSRLTGMGTTVVAVVVSGETAWFAHVGDSRLYLIRDGAAQQLTRDHTMVNLYVDAELITAAEAERHPDAHVLARSLGVEAAVDVEIGLPLTLRADDALVLCSDGVHGPVPAADLAKQDWMRPVSAARSVLELVSARDGDDNASIVAVAMRESDETAALTDVPDVASMLEAALKPKHPVQRDPRATPVPAPRRAPPTDEIPLPPKRTPARMAALLCGGALAGILTGLAVLSVASPGRASQHHPVPPLREDAPPVVVPSAVVEVSRPTLFFAPGLGELPHRAAHSPSTYVGPVPPGDVEEAVVAAATSGACERALDDALAATGKSSVYGPIVGFAWRCVDLTYQQPLSRVEIDQPGAFASAELLFSGGIADGDWATAARSGIEHRLETWISNDLLREVALDLFGTAATRDTLRRDVELEAMAAAAFARLDTVDEAWVPHWARRVHVLRRVRTSVLAEGLDHRVLEQVDAALRVEGAPVAVQNAAGSSPWSPPTP